MKEKNIENKNLDFPFKNLFYKKNDMEYLKLKIGQQKEKLAKLVEQYKKIILNQEELVNRKTGSQQKRQHTRKVPSPPVGYWIDNYDTPYFYSDSKINYDFPAGFAYNVFPTRVDSIDQNKNWVTSGQAYNLKTIPEYGGYRHPFVGGHSK